MREVEKANMLVIITKPEQKHTCDLLALPIATKFFRTAHLGAGEMFQQLRVLTALREDQSSGPATFWNSNSRGSVAVRSTDTCTHLHIHACRYLIKNESAFKR